MVAALRWVEPDIGIDHVYIDTRRDATQGGAEIVVRVGVAWRERACAANERCVK